MARDPGGTTCRAGRRGEAARRPAPPPRPGAGRDVPLGPGGRAGRGRPRLERQQGVRDDHARGPLRLRARPGRERARPGPGDVVPHAWPRHGCCGGLVLGRAAARRVAGGGARGGRPRAPADLRRGDGGRRRRRPRRPARRPGGDGGVPRRGVGRRGGARHRPARGADGARVGGRASLAALHSGDSDSTAAVAGNLLDLLCPTEVLAHPWRAALEAADLVERIAADLWAFHAAPTGLAAAHPA